MGLLGRANCTLGVWVCHPGPHAGPCCDPCAGSMIAAAAADAGARQRSEWPPSSWSLVTILGCGPAIACVHTCSWLACMYAALGTWCLKTILPDAHQCITGSDAPAWRTPHMADLHRYLIHQAACSVRHSINSTSFEARFRKQAFLAIAATPSS